MNKNISFWITNISNRNVSLGDLNLTIPAYTSINLLDSKHYHLTLEQVQNSVKSGSIFNKQNKIMIRKTAPPRQNYKITAIENPSIPTRERSILKIEEQKYEELEMLDESLSSEIEEPQKNKG